MQKNIAVVGVLTAVQNIEQREQKLVAVLVAKKFNIVSGLATGCDTIAHKSCLACGGKTIAILPTTFSNVFPKENAGLVDEIVNAGGLIITEYVSEPKSRGERINRFIERDRLQAMFVKAVVLVASYLPGAGDSGSRHAMQKAKEYGKQNCYLWTTADKTRVSSITWHYQLGRYFSDIIFDPKTNFVNSLDRIKTKCCFKNCIIYENNPNNFNPLFHQIKMVDHISTNSFDIKGYMINL